MNTIRSTAAFAGAILAGAGAMASHGAARAGEPETVTVAITGLHSARGQVIACLWRDKAGFPGCEKSRTAIRRAVPVTGTSLRLTLPLPATGRYAVTVVHDEDGDGRMKHNFIGMPAEGVGISNNPGGMPGYDKSLVPMAPNETVNIRMRYLFE